MINIYEEILKWKKIWIISDTHFNHQFLIDKGIRPANYQELIIERWKELIDKNDIVFHLWDVIFKNNSTLKEILEHLPGYKILITWNHDKNNLKWYISKWFNEAYEDYIIPGPSPILLTHKPHLAEWFKYNICWHQHMYIWLQHRWEDTGNITQKTRIYSAEIEKYYPILLEDICSDRHISHQYFKTIGFRKIYFRYILHRLKSFLRLK